MGVLAYRLRLLSLRRWSRTPDMSRRDRFKFERIPADTKVRDRRILHAIHVLQRQPNLNAHALGRMVQLSVSHLQHLFKKELGMTVSAYTRELCLDEACGLLKTTHLSIKEIRHAVGIPDGSNFVHLFRKRLGMTPSAYREQG